MCATFRQDTGGVFLAELIKSSATELHYPAFVLVKLTVALGMPAPVSRPHDNDTWQCFDSRGINCKMLNYVSPQVKQ